MIVGILKPFNFIAGDVYCIGVVKSIKRPGLFHGTERSGTELGYDIRNGTYMDTYMSLVSMLERTARTANSARAGGDA